MKPILQVVNWLLKLLSCNYTISFTDCPQDPDLLVILIAVMSGIVGIGIILLLLWKLLTSMVVCNLQLRYTIEINLALICRQG
jgi:hypothetical protein